MDIEALQSIEIAALEAKHTREARVVAIKDAIAKAGSRKSAEVNFLLDQCKRAVKQLHAYENMPKPPDYATLLGIHFENSAARLEELAPTSAAPPAE